MAEVKMKRGLATYADYEDADYGRVGEARDAIVKGGGVVIGESASEEENEARVLFRYPLDFCDAVEKTLGDGGWEVRWL